MLRFLTLNVTEESRQTPQLHVRSIERTVAAAAHGKPYSPPQHTHDAKSLFRCAPFSFHFSGCESCYHGGDSPVHRRQLAALIPTVHKIRGVDPSLGSSRMGFLPLKNPSPQHSSFIVKFDMVGYAKHQCIRFRSNTTTTETAELILARRNIWLTHTFPCMSPSKKQGARRNEVIIISKTANAYTRIYPIVARQEDENALTRGSVMNLRV